MLEKYAENVVNDVELNYGFKIDIESILEMVMEIIRDCFDSEEEMATEVKGGLGLLKRVALLIRVKKATGLSRRKAKKVRDCMLSCGESCGHDEICSGYCEVMDMFSDEYENVD